MTLDNILEEIKKAETIVILTHEGPDGDAVGSALAMYITLKQIGKIVDILRPEYPKIFDFLPSREEVKDIGKNENYDLALVLDCGDIKRLNS